MKPQAKFLKTVRFDYKEWTDEEGMKCQEWHELPPIFDVEEFLTDFYIYIGDKLENLRTKHRSRKNANAER